MDQDIPYYKQYKNNAVTGLIAAALCAALFIGIFIAQRFLEKRRSHSHHITTVTSYKKDSEDVTMKGLDNMGMTKFE